MGTSPERESARAAALQRLAASRQQLRNELIELPDTTPHHPLNIPRRLRALWRTLRRGLRGSPVAGVALTALQQWWEGHPWRATTELVAGELHAQVAPAVRRHPVAAMLLSAGIGLAVVAARPWRWHFVRRQVQPLPGRIVRWLFNQLGAAPGQALLSALLVMLARQAQTRDEGAAPAPPPCQPAPTSEQETGR
ncbi:hypothetical protein [Pelomonas sp. KK5]|uniref:hypothetical protein n=1 Tax=Pelomonas sp. KK5 TaxID=1855730 RepID=UPI00097BFD1F|nr:hypothetical protein [Pelomonas sp. KK5]